MITNKELSEVSLSPTKKDYYQIWSELLDLASKISDRWSPDSTNESDPGIVLLKSLVAIADKLNYNIDKNTLEAFMPSATQQESMRKLTEMMGYTMKYYRAATCKVNVTYNNPEDQEFQIYFPKFTNVQNEEEDINYVLLEDFMLQTDIPSRQISAIEGELVECETNTDNIIYLTHLDDNHRYILPETNIAENGVFIFNIVDKESGSEESEPWQQVANLNTQLPGACVFKFGFDSRSNLPYVQFPDDISQIIKDGLRIKYIRTNGLTGNISAKILSKLVVPAIWSTADDDELVHSLTAEDFTVSNPDAATNGANPESLNAAYNNFKKTIGTFDTLVTCRDYMNKIYQLTKSSTNTSPLVSNAIVSDIRDDINRAVTLCAFDEYGISYYDASLQETETKTFTDKSDSSNTVEAEVKKDLISHFDLILYPFKTISSLNTKDEFKNSFTYNAENFNRISYDLAKNKSISHTIRLPGYDTDTGKSTDIAAIKNYLRLKAKITTIKKVTTEEERDILAKVKEAIFAKFNCHYIDFGEELSTDLIEETIKAADARIKDIDLDEPVLYTTFLMANPNTVEEYTLVATDNGNRQGNFDTADRLYNKLVLRNVLAGRIAAFQYDTEFKTEYSEKTYDATLDENGQDVGALAKNYPATDNTILSMDSAFTIEPQTDAIKLKQNEVIQFRIPNLMTSTTYPSYVNYYLKLQNSNGKVQYGIPATFTTLRAFMLESAKVNPEQEATFPRWEIFVNGNYAGGSKLTLVDKIESISNQRTLDTAINDYGAVFIEETVNSSTRYKMLTTWPTTAAPEHVYVFELTDSAFVTLNGYIKKATAKNSGTTFGVLYRSLGVDLNRQSGKYVDENLIKYTTANTSQAFNKLYVPITHDSTEPECGINFTADGLGQDADYPSIGIDCDYQLKSDEYLLINYTDSKTDESGNETKIIKNEYYGKGTIIRPNFALVDSSLYHNNHTYPKTAGYGNFKVVNDEALDKGANAPVKDPEGMFTLDSNEQICIRKIVEVNLTKRGTYLYWLRNDDNKEANTNYFIFDEYFNGGIPTTEAKYSTGDHAGYKPNAYTLKDGEYLFYTDSKKTDVAYYGAGTLVIRGAETPDITKDMNLGEPTEEDIMNYGLAAAIPWGYAYDLTEKKALRLIEHQYITLTEGDTLISIGNESRNTNPSTTISLPINNNWTYVTNAEYKMAESDNPETLPLIDVTGLSWKVRSRLNFNMSSETAQTLNERDTIVLKTRNNQTHNDNEPIIIAPRYKQEYVESYPQPTSETFVTNKYYKESGSSYVLASIFESGVTYYELKYVVQPLSIYSNYPCVVANDHVDVTITNAIFKELGLGDDFGFKLKLVSLETPKLNEEDTGRSMLLDNYINGDASYTKFSFDGQKIPTGEHAVELNISIPDNEFGLIMFYYIDENLNKTGHVNAKIQANVNGLTIFNIAATDTLTNKITLNAGMQIVKLTPNVKTLKIFADNLKKSTVVFSDLSLVKDVNPKLNYRYNSANADTNLRTGLSQLLADIRATGYEKEFYYNIPVDNSNAIDLNPYIKTDTLASPENWYDANNMANKFVVSEIDADYLDTGLTLSKSSRI